MKGRIIVDIEEIPEDCYQCEQPDEYGYCHWVGKYIDHCGEIGKKHPLCPIEPWEGGKIMDAVEYLIKREKMCEIPCSECGFNYDNNGEQIHCEEFERMYPEKAVKIVEKWAAEHPKKTRQSEFLKMFPNARLECGIVCIDPCEVDMSIGDDTGCKNTTCGECAEKYWLTEVDND